jgi:DNA-binding response OmpR family regulator
VLRRAGGTVRSEDAVLNYGRLVLDTRARVVRVDGAPIPLTPREFEILCLLAEHPRQVFTYEQLLEHFWGGAGDRHTVTVHIGRIREKIETDAPEMIVNIWGVGYRFEGKKQ